MSIVNVCMRVVCVRIHNSEFCKSFVYVCSRARACVYTTVSYVSHVCVRMCVPACVCVRACVCAGVVHNSELLNVLAVSSGTPAMNSLAASERKVG